MYKLVNIQEKNKIPYHTSNDLVTLWQMLDNQEYKYKEMVIVENNRIVAGKNTAWYKSKLNNFKI